MWDVEPYTLDLSDVIHLSDDDLLAICAANPDLRMERNAGGQLEIMSPSGSSSSACEAKVVVALGKWNERQGRGVVFPSSGGFHLPNGAVRAADAAWVRQDAWDSLTRAEQTRSRRSFPSSLSKSDRRAIGWVLYGKNGGMDQERLPPRLARRSNRR